ncbi:OmpA family protein, partial [bacterium]|nr:OmpA family protein [candidate division CSSED10-310 bacterium]
MKKCVCCVLVLIAAGCVSKRHFSQEMQLRDQRIASLESEIESNETRIKTNEENINKLSESAQEALRRAEDAGRLAKGKIVFEVVLTDDVCTFTVGSADLSLECENALEELARQLVEENRGVFIEIQGHTDSSGDEAYNMQLGLDRAESVKRYLNEMGHIPLHTISTISYGESRPVSDNGTAEGRRANRRVVLVVLE